MIQVIFHEGLSMRCKVQERRRNSFWPVPWMAWELCNSDFRIVFPISKLVGRGAFTNSFWCSADLENFLLQNEWDGKCQDTFLGCSFDLYSNSINQEIAHDLFYQMQQLLSQETFVLKSYSNRSSPPYIFQRERGIFLFRRIILVGKCNILI